MPDQPTVTERINRARTIPSGMVHDQPSPTATQVLLRRSLAYLGAASWQDLYALQRGAIQDPCAISAECNRAGQRYDDSPTAQTERN